ncbi:serine/threonine protein kinase [Corallococcus exercitus]|uniref:Serine/threonine protein kinase n=1 Tax=Corallococcus exercitus TaxID=2316736 RepID=A0A7Y4JNM0_9BACT|nr:serine/threonine protein kinase [Corallococcus exercitus]NOK08323.1 serine/threonine protein kinase [Corallococcus exercitus]
MSTRRARLLPSVILLAAFSACTTTGGVSLRPDGSPGPQECSEKALEVMRYLKMRVGDAALAELDANQIRSRRITLYDGPIESMLREDLGTLEATTRLYGQVWTSGPQVVIRWYEAHPPDGDKVPICAVARLSDDQMRKLPESKPGTAILDGSVAAAYVVDSFR